MRLHARFRAWFSQVFCAQTTTTPDETHSMTPLPIENDPELLDMFIEDMDQQSDLWKPTSYWKTQNRRMQRQLEEFGLNGFRTNWRLMRGIDLGPKQAGLLRPPIFKRSIVSRLARHMPFTSTYERYIDNLTMDSNTAYAALITEKLSLLYELLTRGDYSGSILDRVEDSCIGNPNIYEFGEKQYSSNLLHHICLVGLMFRLSESTDFKRVIEIGGGYGVLPEIFFKLFDLGMEYFVEVDIPPLVYVTTQYLKAIFPDKVIDYRQVRLEETISRSDISGKILIIPPWKVPNLRMNFDLFWNSASFQEMEDDVIENYLKYIQNSTKNVFVNTLTQGHKQGLGGQHETISFERLANHIRSKGYTDRPSIGRSIEESAYRAALPRHSAAFFTRGYPVTAQEI